MHKFMSPFQGKVATTMTTKENRPIAVPMRRTVLLNNANSISANHNERIASTSNTSTVNAQFKSKRPSTTSSNKDESEQPAKMMRLIDNDSHTISAHDLFRQIQLKNNIEPKNEPHKNVQLQKVDKPKPVDLEKEMRLLSGNVGDILKFIKKFPTLNTIYEVFANIFKIENVRKPGERTMLLRNAGGPVVQAVYYEIDYKMCDIQVGDAVRAVGKFVNNSRLHIYKISIIDASTIKVVPRLNSIGNFILSGQY